MRCRETAGILFKHRCQEPPSAQCSVCKKPICQRHQRWQGHSVSCVTCLRGGFKDPYKKHSFGHLRDDPYFFWYFRPGSQFSDPYGDEDFSLFDGNDADFGSDVSDDWAGS